LETDLPNPDLARDCRKIVSGRGLIKTFDSAYPSGDYGYWIEQLEWYGNNHPRIKADCDREIAVLVKLGVDRIKSREKFEQWFPWMFEIKGRGRHRAKEQEKIDSVPF